MGDKSPRSTDRKKKQAATAKNQKQVAAKAKANPTPVLQFNRKGK
jgi:hypothetical protein